ncbi:MAG: serine/threonine protein kinase, partial [Gemmataceae bacterium]|nr:serine/threonine protein kinase [Gemmataceae bacterium]
MAANPHARADELFDRALDLPPTHRAAYLDAACPGEPAVRSAVDSLLAHADRAEADRFLADPTPLPGGLAGPQPAVPGYDVVRELGRGGAGVVYLARHLGLRRPVALKVVGGGRFAGPEERARFRREAEAAARLRHPHIVTVYDVGEQDGCPYLALEYVPGGTLARRLAGAPLAAGEAAGLVETLARAVDHSHRAGVVHRDLKPANILLGNAGCGLRNAESEDKGPPGSGLQSEPRIPHSAFEPKVTDFGLAWVSGDGTGLTATGAVMGTPSYMAPEQAEGRPAGPAADVYALGAVLYECLTGRPPFKAATTVETLIQVREADPVPPSRLQPGLPRDLETVCLKCLRKDPAGRYGSAGDLADDLRRFLDGRPVAARPVPATVRAWKWANRNRGVAASLSVAVLALTGGAGVAAWKALDERAARKSAEDDRNAANRAEAKAAQSAETEREARGVAQRRLTQVEAGAELMDSLFRGVDPRTEEKEGKPLRAILADRVTEAADKLDGDAVGDPLSTSPGMRSMFHAPHLPHGFATSRT